MSEPDPGAIAPVGRPTADVDKVLQAKCERDEVFCTFYLSATKGLVAFLIVQCGNVALAADVTQETMAALYQRWDEVTHRRAWVYRVASRILGRELFAVRRDTPTADVPEPVSLLRTCEIESWEQQHDLVAELLPLPLRQRQVMAWTLAGFTPTEIAEELSLTSDAVRASLYQARNHLKARRVGREEST